MGQGGRRLAMVEVTTLFWDVGGVILSNGWDRAAREQAAGKFGLDRLDFEDRHELSGPAFETGQVTLDEYMQRTIFYRPRPFTRAEFPAFLFAQSREYPEARCGHLSSGAAGDFERPRGMPVH